MSRRRSRTKWEVAVAESKWNNPPTAFMTFCCLTSGSFLAIVMYVLLSAPGPEKMRSLHIWLPWLWKDGNRYGEHCGWNECGSLVQAL
jgi:hypothetical protein